MAAPVVAAAAIRLGLLSAALARGGLVALIQPDTASYLRPGRNLLLHGQFFSGGVPELERTPGYALFLALLSGAGPLAAILVQILLSAASALLVWRIARAVFSDQRTALLAAWLFAFEPLSVIYSVLLLSETLFLALFLLSLERMTEFLRSQRLHTLAVAGLWLAAATFVRPVTYYLPFALAVGLLAVLARVPGLRPSLYWKAPAVLLLSTMPWLAAWQVRNYVETGFAGFSSIQAQDLYYFSAGEVTARLEHRTLDQVDNDLGYGNEGAFLARHPEAATWNQKLRIDFMRSEAVRVLRANPGLFARTHAKGMMRTVLNPGAAVLVSLLGAPLDKETFVLEHQEGQLQAAFGVARQFPRRTAVLAAFELVLLALYAFALRAVLRRSVPGADLCLLLGLAFYFAAVSGGAVGAARFRLPIMPEVCILAAAGILRPTRAPEPQPASLRHL
ncbi:MAG: glycosyltransferase family 39 protein [Terracidiphilus sp.]|nr:glycosyltransferase family 39 protein [Terracidiphilus sp.]